MGCGASAPAVLEPPPQAPTPPGCQGPHARSAPPTPPASALPSTPAAGGAPSGWHDGTAVAVTGGSAAFDPSRGQPGAGLAAALVTREQYASDVVDDLLGDVMLDFGL